MNVSMCVFSWRRCNLIYSCAFLLDSRDWIMLIYADLCCLYTQVFLVQTAILDLNLVENPGLAALKDCCVRWLPYKQFMFGLVIIQWHETNTIFHQRDEDNQMWQTGKSPNKSGNIKGNIVELPMDRHFPAIQWPSFSAHQLPGSIPPSHISHPPGDQMDQASPCPRDP